MSLKAQFKVNFRQLAKWLVFKNFLKAVKLLKSVFY